MGVLPSILITISMLTQGPLPVVQAAAKARTALDSARIAVLTGVAGCGLILLAVALIPKLRSQFVVPHDVPLWLLALIVGNSALYALANLLIVMATFALGAPRFGIVFTLRVVAVAMTSKLVLGEAFPPAAIVGDVIIVTAVFVTATLRGCDALQKAAKAAAESEEDQKNNKRPPLRAWLLAISATLAFGIANALDAVVVKHMTAVTYAPIRLLLPAILTGLVLVVRRRMQRRKPAKEGAVVPWGSWLRVRWLPLLGIVAFMPVSATTFMWAVQLTNKAGLLAAFHQTSLFPTIIIGALLGGGWGALRRELKRYAFPAALCCLGVAIAVGALPLPL